MLAIVLCQINVQAVEYNINNVTPCIQLLADDFDIKFFPIHHFSVWHLLVSHG